MVKGCTPPGEASSMREIPMLFTVAGEASPMGMKESTRGAGGRPGPGPGVDASLKAPKPTRAPGGGPPGPRAPPRPTTGDGEASLENDIARIMLSPCVMVSVGGPGICCGGGGGPGGWGCTDSTDCSDGTDCTVCTCTGGGGGPGGDPGPR